MKSEDWQWKIAEATDSLAQRYAFIGRTTGVPFLVIVYPPEAERAALREWHTQTDALRPEIEVMTANVLDITQSVLSEMGVEATVQFLENPMPGSDTRGELGQLWLRAVADKVRELFAQSEAEKPVVSIERTAALYPATGPRSLMQYLWGNAESMVMGPVVLLIPGELRGPRTYSFLGLQDEFMYRGDLL